MTLYEIYDLGQFHTYFGTANLWVIAPAFVAIGLAWLEHVSKGRSW